MKAEWVRLWHDMPIDPKWRTIARKSGQRIGDVIAVFTLMLVNASSASERGTVVGLDTEDVATALDIEVDAVSAILAAMQGKVIEGNKLSGWDKRQPKREDDNAAARQASRRERAMTDSHAESRNVTQCHAESRAVTKCHALEGEKREKESKSIPLAIANGPGREVPDPAKVAFDAGRVLLSQAGVGPKQVGAILGRWRRDHGDSELIAALGRAKREGAIDPVGFIEGCFRQRARDGPLRDSAGVISILSSRPAM